MRAGCHTVPLMCTSCWLEPLCPGCVEETGMSQLGCQWSVRGRMSCSQRLFSLCSYLGLGLMSARLAILGGVEGKPCKLWAVLRSWFWAQGVQSCDGGRSSVCPSHWALVTVAGCIWDECRRWHWEIPGDLDSCQPQLGGGYGTSKPWLGCEGALLRLQDSVEQGWGWRIWIHSLCFFLMWLCFTSAVGEGEELISPCLSPGFQSEWQHAEIVYKIKGQKAGIVIYHPCYLG